MSERHLTRDLFYSYPDWLIAQVCVVHIQTARHWKAGIRKPGPTAQRLWKLYTDGRILGDEWLGFAVRGSSLVNPEGQQTTQAQLRAWPLIWQIAAEYARTNPGAGEILTRLIARLDKPKEPRAARVKQASRQSRDLLPRVTPNPSTLPTMILSRSTRKRVA